MTKIVRQASKYIERKVLCRALLPALIASALASTGLQAQDDDQKCVDVEGTPPGLYATTDEGRTFLIQGDQTVELAPGEAAFANEDKLTCINKVPDFLDWPCATDIAQGRMFATYRFDELQSDDVVKEIVRRYFEIPEVIVPIPDWVDGEFTTSLDMNQIIEYSSAEFWYRPNTAVDIMHEKRPKTLLISLYVGINQVVIDNYTVDALNKYYAGDKIPVVFLFNDSNVVPVSYFGSNVSLEEVYKAFNERQIKLAEVPMWPLGDYHFSPTVQEFEKYFELPGIDEIDGMRRDALEAELETYGFTRKPIFVTMLEDGKMYVDDPDRVRVAINMGKDRLESVINFVEQDSHLRRCGPGTPVGARGISGATTPIGGAIAPPGTPPASTEPSEPEPNPSDS